MSLTPILGLTIPTVNGDEDTWGNELNGDLAILDAVGAGGVVSASSNFLMSIGSAPEAFYRITTGGLTVTGTLPDPGAIPVGKLFTVKIQDVGGAVVLSSVNPSALIDGNATYTLNNQYAFVRLLANGATYDVVAQG